MKKLMLTLLVGMVFILAACGGRVETTTVCEIDQNETRGIVSGGLVATLDATGDRITRAELRMSYHAEEFLEERSAATGSDIELDELVVLLEQTMALMNMDGVEVEVEVIGDYIYTIQKFDFDAMSDEDFRSIFGEIDLLSLSVSIEEYEEDFGGTCTTTER